MLTLDNILTQRTLSAVFQPIIRFAENKMIGFEGLIRGPQSSTLHAPDALFTAAAQQDRMLELETLSRQIIIKSFAAQKLSGKLFLNISPNLILHPSFKGGRTLDYLQHVGISPANVVIEITENQPTLDFEAVRRALEHYRGMGFQIAIDDLGAGFSSLRLWSELRPDFVKIDMHFVQGAHNDRVKQQFLSAIQQIAHSCGTLVIAEGIELPADFRLVRQLGIACGQGYLIARPAPHPDPTLNREIIALLQPAPNTGIYRRNTTVESILHRIEAVEPDTCIETIFARLADSPHLPALPVVQHHRPVGLINRYEFAERFSKPFRRELLSKKPCSEIMRNAPLLVEKSTPIQELSDFLSASDVQHFIDGFIITEQGRYLGIGTSQDLLREITKMQIEHARYANPLTLLPGNVPISEAIQTLLQQNASFAVCYADLDHFKAFNDVYGYQQGDELIKLTGNILQAECAANLDFIGHIGGDDFILLLKSDDWEMRCQRVLSEFARQTLPLFMPEHLIGGGYLAADRQGKVVRHPLPTLSIGVVWVEPHRFPTHYAVSEAASMAKKMAKSTLGNSLFIERREQPTPSFAPIISSYRTIGRHDDPQRIA